MANPYFRFKQFTVYHNKCAMKVGTDGVLLGAWAKANNAKTALDIGTGTGLLALMLAQQQPKLIIDAIDIDKDAIVQATDNVKRSPFSAQIDCKHISLQNFAANTCGSYDLIVSNPPYFSGSLKSDNRQRTLARHTDSLYLEELLHISKKLVSAAGRIVLIYPHQSKEKIIELGHIEKLYPHSILNVFPTYAGEAKRVLIEFGNDRISYSETDLVIERERHVYTADFIALVKDFYLHL